MLAPSKCKSGLLLITGTCLGRWKQSFRLRLWYLVCFQVRPHHATSYLRCHLESQHQSVLGCAKECGDPPVQSGGWWQTLDVPAGLGTCPQVQRDPGLASEGVLRLCTLLSLNPPLPPTWTRWTTLFGHTTRISPIGPPTTPKPAWSAPSTELPPALVENAWFQSRIRIEAVIEAEGGYIE